MKFLSTTLFLLICSVISVAQTANAGTDKTVLVGEPVVLDGSSSSGGCDGLITDTENNCIRWEIGYGSWTSQGNLTPTVSYPDTGVFTNTLYVCLANGTCNTDTMTVTVNAITEGTETVVGDSGNVITNGTNLCNALTTVASSNDPVITITAGVTYDFDGTACSPPNRTGSGYVTIRTSAHASLPNKLDRIFPSHSANLAIITPGDHTSNSSINSAEAAFRFLIAATPAHHYRFLGIKFAKKYPTLDYSNPRAFIDIGSGTLTTLSELPHHIIVDRCYFDGGNDTAATQRGVAVLGNDISISNSYIYRVKGAGLEVQAIWWGAGERLGLTNNYLSATSENFMSGGADILIYDVTGTAQGTGNDSTHIKLAAGESSTNDIYNGRGIFISSGTGSAQDGVTITDYDGTTKIATVAPAWATIPDGTSVYKIGSHVPSYLAFRRNHLEKDIGWCSSCGAYLGVDHAVKNIFESKQGKYWTVEGNRFNNHWTEDQNWAITLTIRNQDGKQSWAKISYIDFAHNKIDKVGNGFQILTSDYLHTSLAMDHVLIRHVILSKLSFWNGTKNYMDISDGGATALGGGDRISVIRTSNDAEGTGGQGRIVAFGESDTLTNFIFNGNVGQGYFRHDGGFDGAAALNAATGGSYLTVKNGFYLAEGTLPANNTTVSTRADVKFVDVANGNLKLASDSPFLTVGIASGRAGADTDKIDILTYGTVTGVWSTGFAICNWHTNPVCN